MFLNKWPLGVLVVLLLCATHLAHAAVDEDVIITADSARFHQHEGWGIYEGNAELEQGSRNMKARTIKLFVNNDGELVRVEAEGNPVTLRDGNNTHARAQKLVYRVAEETITLTDNAYINNEGRTFEGPRVVYHLNTQNVEASGQKPGERVRLVIPGEKKK